jgi:hypothetical protein
MANGSNHLVSIVRPPPLLTWVVSQPQHHFNLPVYGSACVLEAHLAIEALGLYYTSTTIARCFKMSRFSAVFPPFFAVFRRFSAVFPPQLTREKKDLTQQRRQQQPGSTLAVHACAAMRGLTEGAPPGSASS